MYVCMHTDILIVAIYSYVMHIASNIDQWHNDHNMYDTYVATYIEDLCKAIFITSLFQHFHA